MGIADKLFGMKAEKAASNLKAGQEFLAANKEKPGVTALPSGLQYEIITQSEGEKPTEFNKVTCHYHGTLINGTVFDSSVQRGKPASFPLNMVIKGWTEGLQLMSVGSKYRFFIPPHLGYGDRQVSAEIGPNSTLIFEVELLGIN
jgi:FKBP-type peptidyl-prolyl cis-trans isomerase FklB